MRRACKLVLALAVLYACAQLARSAPSKLRGAGKLSEGGRMAEQVVACLPDSCINRRTTWQHMLDDVPSCVAAQRAWWSDAPPRMPVTLVTQLSVDRLQALRAQCATWGGPLAAAIYLPLHNPGQSGGVQLSAVNKQKLQTAVAMVEEFFKAAEVEAKMGGCQARLLLVYEVFMEERAVALYPVNALRNYARLLADTPLIANIDVDMLPSVSLSQSLAAPSGHGSASELLPLLERSKGVVVVPAFETQCGGPALADELARGGKPGLAAQVDKACLQMFRGDVAPACHNSTDFPRWFKMGEPGGEQPQPYQVDYVHEFEPWFISRRTATQWFDVRYRGYGKNKIQQVAHTAAMGATFFVHPTGFLVHRPHTESAARKHFLRVKFKSRKDAKLLTGSLFEHIEAMWGVHVQEIREHMFEVVVDAGLSTCLGKLPWWRPGGDT